ncbi:hypothetical protein DUI87_18715 [Hirundo rustica rustica]|uniref:PDEase domain-containing protein n=1 Tax=Hirundo rustica rustica TaxID=333673 RepID=A0A3M0JZD6_HIRRU|nr:hypothetical protein DUI87_18715 [Hirundo rustica rustica]
MWGKTANEVFQKGEKIIDIFLKAGFAVKQTQPAASKGAHLLDLIGFLGYEHTLLAHVEFSITCDCQALLHRTTLNHFSAQLLDTPVIVSKQMLRSLVKQLERGEASVVDLKKNLEYAATVLESIYIDETRHLLDTEDELSDIHSDSVPSEVRDWLASTFTRQMGMILKRTEEKPRFRSIVHAVQAGIFVERMYRRTSNMVGLSYPPAVIGVLKNVDKWSFDVFALNDASGDHALKFIFYELLTRYDLINRFKIPISALVSFVEALEVGYSKHKNPYHNLVHAADVTQTVHYLLFKTGTVGKNHFPNPAGYTIPDIGQDAIGLLGQLSTLLDHVQAAANQYPQVPFCLATVRPHCPQPVVLQGVVVTKVQDLALSLVKLYIVGFSPSIQPVQVALQSSPTLQQIDIHNHLGVVCKFADGRFDPFIQIINKDLKQDWAHPYTDPWETLLVTGHLLDAAPFTTPLWAWPSSQFLT